MTAKTDALRELLEAVEADNKAKILQIAGETLDEVDDEEYTPKYLGHLVILAYGSSLNSAKDLQKSTAPEFRVNIMQGGCDCFGNELPDHWTVMLFHKDVNSPHFGKPYVGQSKRPSCAWLIANLKALIAKETAND